MTSNTLPYTRSCLVKLQAFVGSHQLETMSRAMQGPDKHLAYDQACKLWKTIESMPVTYAQDGLGDEAIVHLHYSYGDMHWFITERDESIVQLQAFGYAHLGSKELAELGYISIQELAHHQVRLDMSWKPKTLAQCKFVLG